MYNNQSKIIFSLLALVISAETTKTKASFLEVLNKTLQNSSFYCNCNT